ncbi:MAG: hypothetical protein LC772_12020, partial [Chloroflexi bacterium]|nr:hypothetical protein [Chloroflexota bacterium]
MSSAGKLLSPVPRGQIPPHRLLRQWALHRKRIWKPAPAKLMAHRIGRSGQDAAQRKPGSEEEMMTLFRWVRTFSRSVARKRRDRTNGDRTVVVSQVRPGLLTAIQTTSSGGRDGRAL